MGPPNGPKCLASLAIIGSLIGLDPETRPVVGSGDAAWDGQMLTVAYCSIPGNGFGKAVAAEATLFRTTLQLTPLNTAFLPPMRVTNWIAEWASPSSARGRQIGEILRQQTADLICITEGEGRSCHRPKELSGVRSKASASAYEVVAQHPELKSLVARK